MNFIRPIGSAANFGMEGNSGKIILGAVNYTLNGQVVGLFRGRKLSTAALTVTVGAQNVTLVKVGGKNLILGAATYTVGGQAITIFKAWKMSTAAAVFAVGEQDITLTRGRLISSVSADYVVGGQAVTLRLGKSFVLDSPLYTINGQALAFGRNRRLTIAAFTVAVNAQNITMARYAKRVILDPRTVTLNFGEVALYKLPPKSYDVTLLYNKGRGKKRFWQAVRAKEMIDPDF